jgi:hypothetical protein
MVLADPSNWWPTLENRKGVQANILSCSLDFTGLLTLDQVEKNKTGDFQPETYL